MSVDIRAPHWVGISTSIEGVSFPILQNTTIPVWDINGELFLGKHFYFYTKIGLYDIVPRHQIYNNIDYMGGLNIVIGFGGYIYNDRSWTTGQGWSIMLNGGVAYRIALSSPLENTQLGEESQTTPVFHNLGIELNMKFNYNFLQFFGVSFGS